MNSLRFLLVHRNPAHSEEIAQLLTQANHTVLPTSGFAEAADALTVERFDAVLMASEMRNLGLGEFSALLRRMEQNQREPVRIPVIALDPDTDLALEDGMDCVMPEPIDPQALTSAVDKLAHALAKHDDESQCILDPEKFGEQLGGDLELMVEIIDLFLTERQKQEVEMRDSLMSKKFDVLCRWAHTIKGSLSSLHAMKARGHAQTLELAAKNSDEDVCWEELAALEAALVELEPALLELRAQCL